MKLDKDKVKEKLNKIKHIILSRKMLTIICAVIVLVVVGAIYIYKTTDDKKLVLPNMDGSSQSYPSFIVEIYGEVKRPGIYQVNQSYRIKNLITMAGGLTESADISQINTLIFLTDGDRIYIPKFSEESLLDLYILTVEDLVSKVELTQNQAQALVDYIKTNGRFKSYEDILLVKGITNNALQKIKKTCRI